MVTICAPGEQQENITAAMRGNSTSELMSNNAPSLISDQIKETLRDDLVEINGINWSSK